MNKYRLPLIKIEKGEKYYLKLSPSQKIQHYILAITFILLVATGFPLKFYYYPWAKPVIDFFGGLQSARIIHRINGVIMVGLFLYHWYYLFKHMFRLYVIPALKTNSFSFKELMLFIYYSPMFPRLKDIKDFFDFLKYALFFSNKKPQHDRFHWREKFDYWAVFWGIPVLGLTGVFLWYPVWSTSIMPGWVINISYIAHSDEALLAVSVIFIWHMYNAHFNYDKFPMSPLFATGYLPEDLMKHEYYYEWLRINKLVEKDPTLIEDVDKRLEQEKQTDEEKLNMIREQIAFMSKRDRGGHNE